MRIPPKAHRALAGAVFDQIEANPNSPLHAMWRANPERFYSLLEGMPYSILLRQVPNPEDYSLEDNREVAPSLV